MYSPAFSAAPVIARVSLRVGADAWKKIMATGNRAHLAGLNIIGLQRRGFARADIHALRRAYRLLFADEGTMSERVQDVALEYKSQPIVQEIVAFIREGGKRSLLTPNAPTKPGGDS